MLGGKGLNKGGNEKIKITLIFISSSISNSNKNDQKKGKEMVLWSAQVRQISQNYNQNNISHMFSILFKKTKNKKQLSEQEKNSKNYQRANIKLVPQNEVPLLPNNSFK